MKAQIVSLFEQALAAADLPQEAKDAAAVQIERTRERAHGDYACNLALMLAKPARRKPRDIADALVAALPEHPAVVKVDIAGPGFINVFLSPTAYAEEMNRVLDEGDAYGRNNDGDKQKVQVEFVSANPTGPLHVGHGRGAAIGDCMARLLEATGWNVTREFYYNDAGNQIDNLARSVQARCKGISPDDAEWPEDGYRGSYIQDVAAAYLAQEAVEADDIQVIAEGDSEDLEAIRHFAVAYLRREQDIDLKAFGVRFDEFFLESSLYADGKVEETVENIIARGHAYEDDGALWLKTTDFGDDKDRVMRKREGGYTYFLTDVAYHVEKWNRGYHRVINEHGADHHSTLARVRAGLQALEMGIPKGWPEYVLHQMVTVTRGGEEVKISKRAGSYVTLHDLIEEVGRDATRYFLISRKQDSQLTFDIDLARSQTNDNPVYYIQYAHARICSVERQLEERGMSLDEKAGRAALANLDTEHEDQVMVMLSRYPEMVASAAQRLEPHLIAAYLHDLAAAFHTWYNAQHFIVDDATLRNARITLAMATRQVLKNGLELLGVNAPDSM